jgi:hypothetical protein
MAPPERYLILPARTRARGASQRVPARLYTERFPGGDKPKPIAFIRSAGLPADMGGRASSLGFERRFLELWELAQVPEPL